jgi:hypothetical protein
MRNPQISDSQGMLYAIHFTYDSYCAISHTRLVTATAVGASQGPRGLAVLKTKASLMK